MGWFPAMVKGWEFNLRYQSGGYGLGRSSSVKDLFERVKALRAGERRGVQAGDAALAVRQTQLARPQTSGIQGF
jgi:hypothetical protein